MSRAPGPGPVNLNRVRKARARAEEKLVADANAAKYGQTKAEKELQMARASQARAALDAHRRETE